MLLSAAATFGMVAGANQSWAAPSYTPDNTVTVVDPSPVNWLSITWNTMEEANRVDMNGDTQPALAESWSWTSPTTLRLKLRKNVSFQDGTPFTAASFKQAFDKVQDWKAPHPPGAFLNYASNSQVKIVDDHTVDMVFPSADSSVFMKLRGMHVASPAFWTKLGFVDKKTGSAEGHW